MKACVVTFETDNAELKREVEKYLQGIMDRADRKTENCSEIPNNCETCRFELHCPEMCEGCCEWDSHYEPKDEPTISKMEQVKQRSCDICKGRDIEGWRNPCIGCTEFAFYEPKDEPFDKDINVRSKDEPQTCDNCKLKGSTKWCNNQVVCRAYKPMDEPQTEPLHTCSVNGRPYSECSSCEHFKCTADEPQTDCAWR